MVVEYVEGWMLRGEKLPVSSNFIANLALLTATDREHRISRIHVLPLRMFTDSMRMVGAVQQGNFDLAANTGFERILQAFANYHFTFDSVHEAGARMRIHGLPTNKTRFGTMQT